MKLMRKSTYVRVDGLDRDGEWMEHLDGTDWFDAPAPHRLHRCRPQTRGMVNPGSGLELVERCACGSLRLDGHGPWINRNAKRA